MRSPTPFGGPARRVVAWAVIALTFSGGLVLHPGPAAAADPQALGRKHSRRAAQLAAANKCRAAIVEYGKALALLNDPVLLFNRGECYRRINDNERALADYRRFLQEIPEAPNRAQVAARIAEIEQASGRGSAPAVPPVAATPPAAAGPPAPVSPAPAPALPPASASAPAPPSPSTAAPVAVAPAPSGGDRPMAPGDDLGSGAPSLQPKFADPQIVMVDGDAQTPARDGGGSVVGRWWFWTAVGAVLIAGGIATYLVLNPAKTEVPPTRLGNYPF